MKIFLNESFDNNYIVSLGEVAKIIDLFLCFYFYPNQKKNNLTQLGMLTHACNPRQEIASPGPALATLSKQTNK